MYFNDEEGWYPHAKVEILVDLWPCIQLVWSAAKTELMAANAQTLFEAHQSLGSYKIRNLGQAKFTEPSLYMGTWPELHAAASPLLRRSKEEEEIFYSWLFHLCRTFSQLLKSRNNTAEPVFLGWVRIPGSKSTIYDLEHSKTGSKKQCQNV